MSEAGDLTNRIMIAVQREFPCARVWRCSVGGAYPPPAIRAAIGLLNRGDAAGALQALVRARLLMYGGISGLPDIDGIFHGGIRLGIEVKVGRDKQSEDQKTCQRIYDAAGAIYIVARDVEGCLAELRNHSKLK
jgi:hypothetical protein